MSTIDVSLAKAAAVAAEKAKLSKLTSQIKQEVDSYSTENKLGLSIFLREDFTKDKPRNTEQLFLAVEALFGIRMPFKAVSPGMQTPMEWLDAMFFHKNEATLAMAHRGGSKTFTSAIGQCLMMMFNPGWESINAGATKVQASVTQKYLRQFSRDPIIGRYVKKGKVNVTEAEFVNNSHWKIVTGSISGVSGQHPNSLFLDEIEFWDLDAIEQTWAVPQAKSGYERVWCAFSTRQRCLPHYTRVITEDGPMKIGKIVNSKYSGKVRVWDAEKKEWTWRKVVQWHRNGSSTEWYKVYTKHTGLGRGCELIATGDHYVYYDVDKKKQLRDFTTDDCLVVSSWVPSVQQKQVLYGKLLGDGHIQKGSFRVEHSAKQKSYVEWFAAVMSEICADKIGYNKKRDHYLARTLVNPYMHNLESEWYGEGTRRIPDYVWDELDDLGLAVWFMDDGSYRNVSTDVWHIYCNNFNQHERDKAEQWFNDRGIKITWQVSGKDKYGYIGGDSAREVTRRVSKYIDVSRHLGKGLGYKNWIASSELEHGTYEAVKVPIERIEVEKTKPMGCYDIGVEEIHNYTNGSGVLVSNSYGAMNRLVDEASAKGLRLFTWTVFESMERCRSCEAIDKHPHGTDEQRQSVCNLWEDCHGILGTKSLGWMKRKDVMTLKQNMNFNSWQTQGLCRKPSSAGLVLHNFEHELKMAGGNYTMLNYNPDLPYYVVHDPAEGKKSVLYVIQVIDGCSYVVWESIIVQCKNDAAAKRAFIDDFFIPIANRKMPLAVVVDPHRPDACATWRSYDTCGVGFNAVMPTQVANNHYNNAQIGTTINLLRTEIEENGRRKVFINPVQCPGCINGIKEYHYPSDLNGNVTSDTPAKEFSDEIDPLRYWVMYKRTALDSSVGISFLST